MGDTYPGLRMSASELGCTYAALVLHADGAEITEDKIKTLLSAANVECESFWPGLFVKAFAGQDMDELITSPGGGGGGDAGAAGGDAGAAAGGGDAPAKKKTTTEEDDMPAAGGLFDDADDY